MGPKGQVIVAFSNRMFFTKAPQIWTDGDDRDHLRYVSSVLMAQGWPQPRGQGDPFFAVVATKPWAEQSGKGDPLLCSFVVVLQIPSPVVATRNVLPKAPTQLRMKPWPGSIERWRCNSAHPLLWLRRRSPDPTSRHLEVAISHLGRIGRTEP